MLRTNLAGPIHQWDHALCVSARGDEHVLLGRLEAPDVLVVVL